MKVNVLDAHDRYLHFTKQSFSIAECCQDLIDKRPFGNRPFYIFAHARTEDNEPGVKRLIWQPRLTKPKAQTNSMLFKAFPGTDTIRVIWMIPDRCMWPQFTKGLVCANQVISQSIHDFQFKRNELEQREEDDLSDEEIDRIYLELSKGIRQEI
jgi:hypothetical protein